MCPPQLLIFRGPSPWTLYTGVPGNLAPPGLGNLAPLSEIWPPFTNMDVKQFCARTMHCKCINFVTIIYYSTHVC